MKKNIVVLFCITAYAGVSAHIECAKAKNTIKQIDTGVKKTVKQELREVGRRFTEAFHAIEEDTEAFAAEEGITGEAEELAEAAL